MELFSPVMKKKRPSGVWCKSRCGNGSLAVTNKRGDLLLPPPQSFLTPACSQKDFWKSHSIEKPLSSSPSHWSPASSVMGNAPPWGMCRSRRTQRWWGRHWGIWDISPNTWAKTLWKRRSVRRQWGRQSGSSQIWTGLTSAKSGPGAPLLSYIYSSLLLRFRLSIAIFQRQTWSQKEVSLVQFAVKRLLYSCCK